MEQETSLKSHFTKNHARNAHEVCAYILAEYGQSYCPSGAAKLMHRLGFTYKKPQSMPAQADEAKQEAFITHYETLMTQLGQDEMVVFSDAVHPTHQSRPAHGWFPKGQKTAIKSSSGRKRLNIQGALDLEDFPIHLRRGREDQCTDDEADVGKAGTYQPDHDSHPRLCGQRPLPSCQGTSAMAGKIRSQSAATFPTAIRAPFKPN